MHKSVSFSLIWVFSTSAPQLNEHMPRALANLRAWSISHYKRTKFFRGRGNNKNQRVLKSVFQNYCCFCKGWFTPATEATEETEAESESEESSDLVWIGTTEAEAESEEKETLLILLTPLPIPLFDLQWIVTLLGLQIPTPLPIPSLVWTSRKESCCYKAVNNFFQSSNQLNYYRTTGLKLFMILNGFLWVKNLNH